MQYGLTLILCPFSQSRFLFYRNSSRHPYRIKPSVEGTEMGLLHYSFQEGKQMKAKNSNYGKSFNRQFASGYAAYMMVGSLFRSCRCGSHLEAQHLSLYYREMPQKQQLQAEDAILSLIWKMDPSFLQTIEGLRCEAIFGREQDDYVIRFYTGGFEEIIVSISAEGHFRLISVPAV